MELFKGAVPYALDVNRLTEAFPVPSLAEGRIISHEELEPVVEAKRGTPRYYGVINAWVAKKQSDNGIVLVWQPASGLKVLDPAGVLELAEAKTKQKSRQLSRAVKTYGWVDRARLDSVGQKRLDHQVQVAAKLTAAVGDARRAMAIELAPIQSMPKRVESTPSGQ